MTLKKGSPEEINRMFNKLSGGVQGLLDSIVSLCYFMRGAVPYEEMLRTTPGERDRMDSFINKRLEKESKKLNPNY